MLRPFTLLFVKISVFTKSSPCSFNHDFELRLNPGCLNKEMAWNNDVLSPVKPIPRQINKNGATGERPSLFPYFLLFLSAQHLRFYNLLSYTFLIFSTLLLPSLAMSPLEFMSQFGGNTQCPSSNPFNTFNMYLAIWIVGCLQRKKQ